MSLEIKRADGQRQKIAGHTILLDANASEVRQGTVTFSDCPAGGLVAKEFIFSDPMPDTDYTVIMEEVTSYGDVTIQVLDSTKTVTGFRAVVKNSYNMILSVIFKYTAFKPIKLDGYTELQNKVSNPDNVPTENSENLVKSGGVWEAIKNASAVWKGTEAEWEAVTNKTDFDVAILTDKHMILSVDRTSGEATEQANLNKIWRGTSTAWDALTEAEKDYYDQAETIDNQYTAVPGTLIVAHDKVVATGDWVADTTYSGFGYKADILVADVTDKYSPDVRFNFADANSGVFAGVADCADGKVIVYANAVPADDVTIPVIICTLMEV